LERVKELKRYKVNGESAMPIITVLDINNNPVANMDIWLIDLSGNVYLTGVTDGSGNWDTGPLPSGDYEIILHGDYDAGLWSGQSDIIVVYNLLPPVYSGKITGIRIQDKISQVWYNWDDPERRWYVLNGEQKVYVSGPACASGVNNLYVAFWIVANGTGLYTLTIAEVTDGVEHVLLQNQYRVENGLGQGVEWTGTMPLQNYTVVCRVDP
jgi:hypothetical protein